MMDSREGDEAFTPWSVASASELRRPIAIWGGIRKDSPCQPIVRGDLSVGIQPISCLRSLGSAETQSVTVHKEGPLESSLHQRCSTLTGGIRLLYASMQPSNRPHGRVIRCRDTGLDSLVGHLASKPSVRMLPTQGESPRGGPEGDGVRTGMVSPEE